MQRVVFARRAHEIAATGCSLRRGLEPGPEAAARLHADIVDLSLGNPDLEPAPEVREALRRLAADPAPGHHRYTDNAGLPEVREHVARHLSQREGVTIDADSVLLTCGAAGALRILFGALLDPGDEVVVFAPYFPEYVGFLRSAGAVPVIVRPAAGPRIDVGALAAALTPRTRAVIVNDPNNPTGTRVRASVVAQLAATLAAHRERTGALVHLVADEAGAALAWSGPPRSSMLAAWDAVWLVRSCSKDASLAGERIGYLAWGSALATPETLPLLRATARAHGFASAPALLQRLLPYALDHPLDASEYRRRAERIVTLLRAGGLDVSVPEAGFFVFPRSPVADDRRFCERLLDAGVRCAPGAAFGAPGFFRVSLTQPLPTLERAARRIARCARFVGALGGREHRVLLAPA